MQNIITDRLELRRFTSSDTEPYAKIMTNPEVYRYLGTGKEITYENATKIIPRWESVWEKGYGVFAVIEKSSDTLIGHCGIQPLPDGKIELLYAYDPSAWGKGYATEAGKAVLEYGKKHFDYEEIYAISYPQNKGSISVINKLGFEYTGQGEFFGVMFEIYKIVL